MVLYGIISTIRSSQLTMKCFVGSALPPFLASQTPRTTAQVYGPKPNHIPFKITNILNTHDLVKL